MFGQQFALCCCIKGGPNQIKQDYLGYWLGGGSGEQQGGLGQRVMTFGGDTGVGCTGNLITFLNIKLGEFLRLKKMGLQN